MTQPRGFVPERLLILAICLEREDMPRVQGLAVRRGEMKWRDLVPQKAPLLRHVDVLEPGQSYAVQVNYMVLEGRDGEEDEEGEVEAGACCDGAEEGFQDC